MRERKPPRAVTEASDTVSKSVPSSGPHRPMLAEARAVVDIPVVFSPSELVRFGPSRKKRATISAISGRLCLF
jgi:hypothetical protein